MPNPFTLPAIGTDEKHVNLSKFGCAVKIRVSGSFGQKSSAVYCRDDIGTVAVRCSSGSPDLRKLSPHFLLMHQHSELQENLHCF